MFCIFAETFKPSKKKKKKKDVGLKTAQIFKCGFQFELSCMFCVASDGEAAVFWRPLCKNNATVDAIKTLVSQHAWLIVEGSVDCRLWMTERIHLDSAPESGREPLLGWRSQTLTGGWTMTASPCYLWTRCFDAMESRDANVCETVREPRAYTLTFLCFYFYYHLVCFFQSSVGSLLMLRWRVSWCDNGSEEADYFYYYIFCLCNIHALPFVRASVCTSRPVDGMTSSAPLGWISMALTFKCHLKRRASPPLYWNQNCRPFVRKTPSHPPPPHTDSPKYGAI